MDRRIINPPSLPPPRGVNHGILVRGGHLLFLAGQDASGSDGSIVAPGDLLGQFEQVIRNISAVVKEAGGTLHDVTKLNIFVRDRDAYVAHLTPLGEVFRRYFGEHYPAMALFEVSKFFNDGALIEMEGMAVIDTPGTRQRGTTPR